LVAVEAVVMAEVMEAMLQMVVEVAEVARASTVKTSPTATPEVPALSGAYDNLKPRQIISTGLLLVHPLSFLMRRKHEHSGI
jgi:hypothetical protein